MYHKFKKIIFICILLIQSVLLGQITQQTDTSSMESLNKALIEFVDNSGKVDYEAFRKSPGLLWDYLEFIEVVSPHSHPEIFPNRNSQIAYWINTYNALVIKIIIENPNVNSIKEAAWGFGAFWRMKHTIGGETMSLNYIEHKLLRKQFKDPRIHFAINCASNSCPPLGNRIISAPILDQQLENKTSQFINNDHNVKLDTENRYLFLNRIFKWYKNDFESSNQSMIEYILDYRTDFTYEEKRKIISEYKVKYLHYDWGLNRADNSED